MKHRHAILGLSLLLLGACGKSGEQQTSEKQLPQPRSADFAAPTYTGEGTPMAQRVATLGFLNKRNNITQDLEMKPGESRRIGPALVRLQACEKTAPWETRPETGAFVQLFVETQTAKNQQPKWLKVFSGWLFRESPSLNVVEHPIYDVWVKNCAMRFPGEEGAPAKQPSLDTDASSTSSAPATGDANAEEVAPVPKAGSAPSPVTPAKAAGSGNSVGVAGPVPKSAAKAPASKAPGTVPAPKAPAPKAPPSAPAPKAPGG